jgi:hypothetical protein
LSSIGAAERGSSALKATEAIVERASRPERRWRSPACAARAARDSLSTTAAWRLRVCVLIRTLLCKCVLCYCWGQGSNGRARRGGGDTQRLPQTPSQTKSLGSPRAGLLLPGWRQPGRGFFWVTLARQAHMGRPVLHPPVTAPEPARPPAAAGVLATVEAMHAVRGGGAAVGWRVTGWEGGPLHRVSDAKSFGVRYVGWER